MPFFLTLILPLVLFISLYAQETPHYLNQISIERLAKSIQAPPKKESSEQKKDDAELHALQKARTQQECSRARSEIKVNLKTFYSKPYGPLNERQVSALFDFFEGLRAEAHLVIKDAKTLYDRPRPFIYMKDLTPCVDKEPSLAYPSGHATIAMLYSLVLTDFFPDQKKTFTDRAHQIAHDRVLGGVHHPSDVQAGLQLGESLYRELKKSPLYQSEFQKLKPSL